MGLIQAPRGLDTQRGYAPADVARSAVESVRPDLWRGLVSGGVGGSSSPMDIVAGKPTVTNNELQTEFSPRGRVTRFNANDRAFEALGMPHLSGILDGATALTYWVYARFRGGSSSDEDTLGLQWDHLQGSLDMDAQRVLLRYDSGGDKLELFLQTSSGTSSGALSSAGFYDRETHLIGFQWDGTTATLVVDGRTSSFSASGPLSSNSTSKYPEVLGGHFVTEDGPDSPRFDLASWGLSTRVIDLPPVDDPFAPFRRRPVLIPVETTSPGPVTPTNLTTTNITSTGFRAGWTA